MVSIIHYFILWTWHILPGLRCGGLRRIECAPLEEEVREGTASTAMELAGEDWQV